MNARLRMAYWANQETQATHEAFSAARRRDFPASEAAQLWADICHHMVKAWRATMGGAQ